MKPYHKLKNKMLQNKKNTIDSYVCYRQALKERQRLKDSSENTIVFTSEEWKWYRKIKRKIILGISTDSLSEELQDKWWKMFRTKVARQLVRHFSDPNWEE